MRSTTASHRRHRAAALLPALILALLLAPAALARAQPTPPSDTVRAGVIVDWPPYYTQTSAGRPSGFAIDLFDAVAARAGLAPQYVEYPSFRALQVALEAGEIDVIPNLGMVPGRNVLFTAPVNTFDVGLFVRRSSPRLETHADLSGEVAVVETNVGVQLAQEMPNAHPVVYGDVREALFRLLSGDVDGLIFPSPVVMALARAAEVDHLITDVPPGLAEVKRAIAVAPERMELLLRLDRAVQAFVGTNEYAAIFRRWHLQAEPYWTARRVAIAAGITLLLVVLAAAIIRYITLRRARERIRFHAHLLDVIGEAVIAVDLDNRVIFWNRFAEQMYGWKAAEALGRRAMDLITPPELRGDGTQILDVLRSGRSWQGEFTVMRRDGSQFQAYVANQPIFDGAGRVVGMVGASTDLTERKSLEQQLLQAQKMESIGRLAGGVAHDFNNLLTVISGTTEVVMAELPEGSRHRADLVEVRRASQRAAELTQQLLAFSRRQVVQPRVLNVNDMMVESERMLKRLVGEDVTVTVTPSPEAALVRVDPTQFQQVLLNLSVNARDAMPNGGRLTLAASSMTIDAVDAAQFPGRKSGPHVVIAITDTGVGMDEQTQRHAFEPFFTTKEPGRGTGLGLATVYGIVEQSGGTIELESRPGAGTTFRIFLPRVEESANGETVVPVPRAVPATETILVVEDERAVRELVVRKLDAAGYRVLVAERPDDAVRMGREHKGPIHLLLTDVVMPGMNGPALAAEVTRMHPEAKVLYMTGYADREVSASDASAGALMLMKPFTLDTLATTVRRVLDGGEVRAGG